MLLDQSRTISSNVHGIKYLESRLFKNAHDNGLTIAELLVATGLLGVVLVTVMTLFGQLIVNTDKNSMLSAGAFFADMVLDKHIDIARKSLEDSGDNAIPAFTSTVIEGEETLASENTKYIYRLEAEQIDGFATAEPGQAWYIEVEVRWRMDDMDSEAVRANMGQVNLKRGRMVYLHI